MKNCRTPKLLDYFKISTLLRNKCKTFSYNYTEISTHNPTISNFNSLQCLLIWGTGQYACECLREASSIKLETFLIVKTMTYYFFQSTISNFSKQLLAYSVLLSMNDLAKNEDVGVLRL